MMQANGEIVFQDQKQKKTQPQNKPVVQKNSVTQSSNTNAVKNKPSNSAHVANQGENTKQGTMSGRPSEERTKVKEMQESPVKEVEFTRHDEETFLPEKGVVSAPHAKQKLQHIADKVSHPLMKFTSKGLLPSTVTIDLRKITIDYQPLPFTHEIQSIPNEDLEDVQYEAGLLFATLKIIIKKEKEPVTIGVLHHKDAREAKRVILGLITAIKEQIKLGELDPIQDRDELIKIGMAASA